MGRVRHAWKFEYDDVILHDSINKILFPLIELFSAYEAIRFVPEQVDMKNQESDQLSQIDITQKN